jgi:hypothetical protein
MKKKIYKVDIEPAFVYACNETEAFQAVVTLDVYDFLAIKDAAHSVSEVKTKEEFDACGVPLTACLIDATNVFSEVKTEDLNLTDIWTGKPISKLLSDDDLDAADVKLLSTIIKKQAKEIEELRKDLDKLRDTFIVANHVQHR